MTKKTINLNLSGAKLSSLQRVFIKTKHTSIFDYVPSAPSKPKNKLQNIRNAQSFMDALLNKNRNHSNHRNANRNLAPQNLQHRSNTTVLRHWQLFCKLWIGRHFPRYHCSWNNPTFGKPCPRSSCITLR